MRKSARKPTIRKPTFAAKGPEASRLRQRKHRLARRFGIPDDLLGGSLRQIERKCGKPTCHCTSGEGHPMWTLTYSVDGQRQVLFVPDKLLPQVRPLAEQGTAYREGLAEILTINAQLLSLSREQQRDPRKRPR